MIRDILTTREREQHFRYEHPTDDWLLDDGNHSEYGTVFGIAYCDHPVISGTPRLYFITWNDYGTFCAYYPRAETDRTVLGMFAAEQMDYLAWSERYDEWMHE